LEGANTAKPSLTSLDALQHEIKPATPSELSSVLMENMRNYDFGALDSLLSETKALSAKNGQDKVFYVQLLTELNDFRYNTGDKKRASVLAIVREHLHNLFFGAPQVGGTGKGLYKLSNWDKRHIMEKPTTKEQVLIVDSSDFPAEGPNSLARYVVKIYQNGWRNIILFNVRGQRFIGCGLGPRSHGLRVDVYDTPGDYLASGLDGAEIFVHGGAQDQVANIMKAGRVVVYGSDLTYGVGQTFMYGAKGGEAYVMGNTAGRPFIFTVGNPKCVINGVPLDYLNEQCMAGDPLKGGGFSIVNAISWDAFGNIVDQATPYPGGNLCSLASGGAAYIRDPQKQVGEDQLNRGQIADISWADWEVMLPYLKNNEKLFKIPVERLLTVDGEQKSPLEVYRKIVPGNLGVLKAAHH